MWQSVSVFVLVYRKVGKNPRTRTGQIYAIHVIRRSFWFWFWFTVRFGLRWSFFSKNSKMTNFTFRHGGKKSAFPPYNGITRKSAFSSLRLNANKNSLICECEFVEFVEFSQISQIPHFLGLANNFFVNVNLWIVNFKEFNKFFSFNHF